MNKIYKLLIIILFVFVLSGCNATYNIEIKNNEIKEDFSFKETSNTLIDKIYEMESTDKFTYRGLIENNLKSDLSAFISNSGGNFKKKIIDKDGLGLNYKYNYNVINYNQAYIPNSTFKYFNFIDQDNLYIISTSIGFNCFEQYNYLDSLTIHLKTNHKVKENNADKVEGYNYYWNINRDNYKNKNIYIEMYKDKYIFNYENKTLYLFAIIFAVAFLSLIVIIIMKKKSNDNNKI